MKEKYKHVENDGLVFRNHAFKLSNIHYGRKKKIFVLKRWMRPSMMRMFLKAHFFKTTIKEKKTAPNENRWYFYLEYTKCPTNLMLFKRIKNSYLLNWIWFVYLVFQ